ncbi:SET domain-containing protein [Paraburkholderia caribensis]|uniref:SET domain-containing protein n=1 Tax=Paraburkholderia caribensis TaxID=75105 RepID=UPI001CB2BCED|nr:SET domain-containing protein-lysine N-methyltransferase [Paraburkholderia caribensis]CAG9250760.1 SET domain-containing protein [Paraburkholderia caribensis]
MRRVTVRRSSVHGRGVFALRPIRTGERVLEYKGQRVLWTEAIALYQDSGTEGHTFLFSLSDGHVIDGANGGNSARWLNHSCAANCEAHEEDGRVYIHAKKSIKPGDELFIDYQLEVDGPANDEVRRLYACHCGAPKCSRSMLGDVNVMDETR